MPKYVDLADLAKTILHDVTGRVMLLKVGLVMFLNVWLVMLFNVCFG